MIHHKYLIIGGGMTANAAVRGIREVDLSGSIGVMSAEGHSPYRRPPLSKGLWKGDPEEKIWLRTTDLGVDLYLGTVARRLDPRAKRVIDDKGIEYGFDSLLLATGGAPRRLPFGGESVVYFRTYDDYVRLREISGRGGRIAVIGGGFIGSEIAASLAVTGREVVMVFPEEGIGWRVFPREMSLYLRDVYREKGVEVLPGHSVVGIEGDGRRPVITCRSLATSEERRIEADAVVAGIGIQPAVDLAREAGLEVRDGIVVDESLRTAHPDIFAAGDVASFVNPSLGRLRVEHEDNANTMGKFAGRAMAGRVEPYRHLPFFYSDLFDLGYEAVGELDPRLETMEDWRDPHREGVVYYLKDGRVRGALMINVWGQVDAARRLISEGGPIHREDLKGRLPQAA